MFKSEKHNLIANIIVWIAAIIVIYNAILFEPPLWFNILFPLILGIPIIKNIYRIVKKG
ncbi:hypothetical protein GCM10007111_43420 [Virgibacillus kapii]|uniref:AI-2E family transporter n=1 Tax=Virgibacillus kapii TaxID=1638645 RepID=A0ABQ2DYB5_9BACI|nr:hypothetical protein GCM10007111_43420 [Virgibacillus kapii]